MYAMDGTLVHQEDLKRNKRIYHMYLAGDPVAQAEVDITSGASTSKYLHTDALGSPMAVTNATSGILERTQYEPYGLVINRALRDGPGYTGHVEDAVTALNYMQQRYFDPLTGRFLSVDPVSADSSGDLRFFNRYAYAFDNPYTFNDPDGRAAHVAIGAGVGALFGGGMEIYRQLHKDGKVSNWKNVGLETGKGAIVGGLTAAVPGSTALTFGSAGAKAVVGVSNAVAVGAGGEVIAQAAKGQSIDTGDALMAGLANGVGLGAGKVVEPFAKAAATVRVAGNPGFQVTSLRGTVFTHGATPPVEATSETLKQLVQDTGGSAASSLLEERLKK